MLTSILSCCTVNCCVPRHLTLHVYHVGQSILFYLIGVHNETFVGCIFKLSFPTSLEHFLPFMGTSKVYEVPLIISISAGVYSIWSMLCVSRLKSRESTSFPPSIHVYPHAVPPNRS